MQSMTFRELSDQLVILYNQRKFDDALRLIEEQREFFPEQATRTTFWRMCLLSLAGRPKEVLPVFQQGLDSGQWWSRELFADPDLDAVRDLPEFQRLVAIAHGGNPLLIGSGRQRGIGGRRKKLPTPGHLLTAGEDGNAHSEAVDL